jgi:NhaP-type Na+/H+ or K+/H+ antiporter
MAMGFFVDFFVVGGSQSEEAQWIAYVERRHEALRPPDGRTRWFHFYRAFRGSGHLSSRSRHHIAFVAEVIASIMEMSIFAYLGVFLFSDRNFLNLGLNSTAILSCIVSRAVMVILVCSVINIFVCLDIERRIGRCFASILPPTRDALNDPDDSIESNTFVYLDLRTQQILFLGGVRGAVSFALVENIPVYDAVRKVGSQFKPQLKAMTSSSILFTVFVFGGFTYFLVKREASHPSLDTDLGRRLLEDEPLASESDDSASQLSADMVISISAIEDN